MKIPTKPTSLRALLVLLGCAFSHTAPGALVLADRNSTVSIDPNSSSGTFNWMVDGNSVLAQQWFWYRVGGDTQEYSIDTISAPLTKLVDGDFDAGDEKVLIRYSNQILTIQIEYNLMGGAPGSLTSAIAEQISIQNNSGASLPVTFFQYSDFNHGGPGGSEQVVLDPDLRSATQTVPLGLAVSETVNTPAATFGEAALQGFTLSRLQNGNIDNLNGILGAGPGDVTWALQWDLVLNASGPGSEILISKVKQVSNVPEPAVPLMSMIGGLGFLLRRKRGVTVSAQQPLVNETVM